MTDTIRFDPTTGWDPEAVARAFHETYERLAPEHGYETRKASAVPWEQVPTNNRALMVDVADTVLARLALPEADEGRERMAGLISQSSLGTPGAQALAERTPPDVGRAIVLASGYLARAEAAEAERDRLAMSLEEEQELHGETRAELDRLRSVVEALRSPWTGAVAHVEDQTPRRGTLLYAVGEALDALDGSPVAGSPDFLRFINATETDAEMEARAYEAVRVRPETDVELAADLAETPADDGPAIFARARSLLGQQVKVSLSREGNDPAAVAQGRLLRICDGGELAIEDDAGFVNYCWPMLDIEPLQDAPAGGGQP